MGKDDLFWGGGKTNLKLSSYPKGVEIDYSDNIALERRETSMNAFVIKFNARWSELLKENDSETSARLLKEWLEREGKGLLDSYEVGKDNATLWFKGIGGYSRPAPHQSAGRRIWIRTKNAAWKLWRLLF